MTTRPKTPREVVIMSTQSRAQLARRVILDDHNTVLRLIRKMVALGKEERWGMEKAMLTMRKVLRKVRRMEEENWAGEMLAWIQKHRKDFIRMWHQEGNDMRQKGKSKIDSDKKNPPSVQRSAA
ncbi:hypothetical protein BGW39_008057 [Mortierella sp. 14UC]|nr:hypothetical protein BGW39_008057 [Mortierella sp. 14UC]